MTNADLPPDLDLDAVRAHYLRERDRRLVEGRADIVDLRRDEFFRRFRDDPFTPVEPRPPVVDDIDVAIIGAGMAGVVAGAKLRLAGVERIRMIDEAGGIGGTWYWNQYPGVMCDVESYIYMPMLEELGRVPSHRYAFGPEIHRHFVELAETYGLAEDALLHTGVERSVWDDEAGRWVLHTNRGDRITARYLVMATGILNLMKLPAIPGMETFEGPSFHTARWDFGVTGGGPDGNLTGLAGKSVAILGTGATGIQCIPHLAEAAEHVYVFQRTPSAIGERGNRPTDESFADTTTPGWQWERMLNFQRVVAGSDEEDLIDDGWTHDWGPTRRPNPQPGEPIEDALRRWEELDFQVMEAHRRRVDELVDDPEKAAILKPYYRYICKRPCFHDEYLPSLNSPNVTLVDCAAGVERVTERGLVADGVHYDVDCIIYATGFEAETTSLSRRVGHEVVGRDGIKLVDKWNDTAASLHGMTTRGFPNLFLMPAPGQQAVVTVNHTLITVVGAEHIAATVQMLDAQNVRSFEVRQDAEEAWTDIIRSSFADPTPLMSVCTPSRLNNEGHPETMRAENGSYGGGLGDFFGFLEVLEQWRAALAAGDDVGLDLTPSTDR